MPKGKPEHHYEKAQLLLDKIYDLCTISDRISPMLATQIKGSAEERRSEGDTVQADFSYRIAIHPKHGVIAVTDLEIAVNSEILWLTMEDITKQGYYKQMYENTFKDFLESLGILMTSEILFVIVALHEIGHLDTVVRYSEIGDAEVTEQAFKLLNREFIPEYFSSKQLKRLKKQDNIHPRMELSISENLANQYVYINFYRVYNILLTEGLINPQNKGGQS